MEVHPLRTVRLAVAISIVLGVNWACAWSTFATLTSGVYQTVPGESVEESGERVPNGGRAVPFFATLAMDLSAASTSLAATITNAVLEGGEAFLLTARSSAGSQLIDGSYRFMGDYLRDIYPSGTQYLFDWQFSPSTNGEIVWNGTTFWSGGHLWSLTISNIKLVPVPWLNISRTGTRSVQVTWATNFVDHVLESASGLAAPGWSPVTNTPVNQGDSLSVTLDAGVSDRFYRLRKP